MKNLQCCLCSLFQFGAFFFIKLKIEANIPHTDIISTTIKLTIMDHKILFEKDIGTVKNPKHLQRNVFLLYSARNMTIEPATNIKIDT